MADRAVTLTIKPGIAHTNVDDPSRFISVTKARCVARYRMHTLPGRPEELETNHEVRAVGKRVISFAFAGGELRIRKHGGADNRRWVETRDFRLRDGWLNEVYDFLDDWLGFVPSGFEANSGGYRMIKDNPQA